MIVLPLIVSYLILAVTSLDGGRGAGRMAALSLGLFLALLVGAGVFALLVAPPILDRMVLDPGIFATLGESVEGGGAASGPSAGIPGPAGWVEQLVPENPIGAAARGEILPVLVFTVFFGLALNRLSRDARNLVVGFFDGVAQASMVLVDWILMAMPVGVFALSYAMATTSGLGLAGALTQYLLLNCGSVIVFTALLYLPAALTGAVPIRRFASRMAPAQAVALGTRSSLASLPALLDSSRRMGLPENVTGFVIPLAASTFRVNRPLTSTIVLLFLAQAYGVVLGPTYILSSVGFFILLSFASPGIPSGGFATIFPILIGAGIPIEGALILAAVDSIPDLFKTLVNVTADGVVATVVARRTDAPEEGAPG
jgi:Na+/H+-dicarboxylate symporter